MPKSDMPQYSVQKRIAVLKFLICIHRLVVVPLKLWINCCAYYLVKYINYIIVNNIFGVREPGRRTEKKRGGP